MAAKYNIKGINDSYKFTRNDLQIVDRQPNKIPKAIVKLTAAQEVTTGRGPIASAQAHEGETTVDVSTRSSAHPKPTSQPSHFSNAAKPTTTASSNSAAASTARRARAPLTLQGPSHPPSHTTSLSCALCYLCDHETHGHVLRTCRMQSCSTII